MQPTGDEVRVQLDRILASEPFANSDRLSRFLRFVVEKSLAGEGDRLKEYVIGTDVFDRGDRYDPRLDSIVRVEAGRLRGKLEEYYTRQGSQDAVIVRIPRGSYAPSFERRPHAASVAPRIRRKVAFGIAAALLLAAIIASRTMHSKPVETRTPGLTIAVLPFKTYSTDDNVRLMAARVTDGVTTELAHLGTLRVVSHTSALQFAGAQRSLREMAKLLDADIVMEASLAIESDSMHVEARLVDAASDRKFWAERFTAATADVRGLQRRIATAATVAAAQRTKND